MAVITDEIIYGQPNGEGYNPHLPPNTGNGHGYGLTNHWNIPVTVYPEPKLGYFSLIFVLVFLICMIWRKKT